MIAILTILSIGLFAGLVIDANDDDDSVVDSGDSQTPPTNPGDGNTISPGDLIEGTSSSETLTGTIVGESMTGRGGDDLIDGQAGNDRIFGDAGNDSLLGGLGNDLVSGGSGHDQMSGSEGDDTVYGGRGDDLIVEGLGTDTINGGPGDDVLWTSFFQLDPATGAIVSDGDQGGDVVNGGSGDDTVLFGQGDTVSGGAGEDELIGGHWLETTEAATITDFEPGDDQIVYAYNPANGPAPELTVVNRANDNGGSDAIVFADGTEVLRVLNQDGFFDPELDIRLISDSGIPVS